MLNVARKVSQLMILVLLQFIYVSLNPLSVDLILNEVPVLCLISGDDNPYMVMNDVIAKYKNFTAKWNGIMGNDHLPRLV